MKESSSESPESGSPRSGAISKAHGYFRRDSHRSDGPGLPVNEPSTTIALDTGARRDINLQSRDGVSNDDHTWVDDKKVVEDTVLFKSSTTRSEPVTSAQAAQQGTFVEAPAIGGLVHNNYDNMSSNSSNNGEVSKPSRLTSIIEETKRSFWLVITYSWFNVLLIFVPAGIAVSQIPGIHGGVVFAINAVAIVPLAGQLAFATESVASKMGDSLGALLNVTFGNAVELIIFIIALTKDEIRIVQASLLGSILANLLLILGMGFFLGGLRFREQIYNSTVTQMSACLLSLSVISLVLPTAFHASFSNDVRADEQSLKISRGTSVILLLVYVIYLLFQLKSHAYMYESTPQHVVDAESIPGPAANWLESSDSDDTSSSSSSDSDSSGRSRDTMRRRMKKVLRGGRRRKSSVVSADSNAMAFMRSGSVVGNTTGGSPEEAPSESSTSRAQIPKHAADLDEDAVEDEKYDRSSVRHKFSRRKHKKHRHKRSHHHEKGDSEPVITEGQETTNTGTRRVDWALPAETRNVDVDGTAETPIAAPNKRPFVLRGVSVKNVKNLAPTVFVQDSAPPPVSTGPVPRVRYGIRRTNSLPDRLNQQQQQQQQRNIRPPGAMLPAQVPLAALTGGTGAEGDKKDSAEALPHLSKPASVILLLISTALVAVCAEFLVGSIEEVVQTSSVGEIFIGLIILPIVGNAAEHVTAVTVAMKNKMDLAIGVAIGSSIQIAIFVTPLVVILGWILDKEMSLYFTLFETVCLFVSAFMVNFLVLDGRSNYLEGALLCAVYLIIAIVAFFYPDGNDANSWGQ